MISLQMKDSRRKERTITVLNAFINDHGTKCAQVQNDAKKKDVYLVRVQTDGSGTCECEGYSRWGRQCYHIKAIASAILPTAEQLEMIAAASRIGTISIEEALTSIVEYAREIENPYDILGPTKKVTCPHCGKHDENYNRYGKCYWLPTGDAL